MGKVEKKAFRICNLLDDAADAIRKRARRAYREGRISLEEYMEERARELELRAEVSVVVASDLSGVLKEVSEAGGNVEQAIRDAKGWIENVRSIRKGLKIVAALVELAGGVGEWGF